MDELFCPTLPLYTINVVKGTVLSYFNFELRSDRLFIEFDIISAGEKSKIKTENKLLLFSSFYKTSGSKKSE